MNCYKCATPLPDNSRFCLSCGADVSGEGHTHERTLAVEPDPDLVAKLQADVGSEYVIDKELGRGGMAIVFLGHDASLGRKVAVKLLPPELTFGAGPSVIERFKREARTSATLDHPNIIPVYRVSQGQKLFWYVMKFLEGESLDIIIEREGQLPVDRTVAILAQAADALDYAHQHQVIHRDIKPANLMIDAKGRVTVTDFGIAKALDASTLTATGSMIGTPYFMSPEQCAGKRVGPGSDQYSLGVMAYLMLGGHLPFTGESVIDIIRKHVMDPVPPLGVLRPQLPQALINVVERGLAKSPDDRFPSCADFARALANASQGLDITIAPPGKVERPKRISKTALISPVPGALRTAKGRAQSKRGRAAVVAGIVVVAAAGLALWRPWAADAPLPPPAAQTQDTTPAAGPPIATADSAATDSAAAAPDTLAAVPAGPTVQPARLTLTGLPRGARIRRNNRPVTGPSFDITAGRATSIEVTATGLQTWRQSITMRAGERRSVAVEMPPAAVTATAPTGAATPPTTNPTGPGRADIGWISLGTRPRSTIYINGSPAPTYPVRNFQVAAGAVRLRFQVTDSTGLWWARDRTVAVGAGDTLNLRFIDLERP